MADYKTPLAALGALIVASSDPDALKKSIATSTASTPLVGAGLDGAIDSDPNLRTANRYLPDNIYDALTDFNASPWITTMVGEDVKCRYADLKQASADRCPRLLGTFVKPEEVQYHHEIYNQYLWNLF